jgi:hypothetical protein
MQYYAPDEGRRALLWAQKLGLLKKDEVDFDIDAAVKELAAPAMNGREISNAVNTARTLAAAENNGLMRYEDLDTVVGVWKEFQANISEIES